MRKAQFLIPLLGLAVCHGEEPVRLMKPRLNANFPNLPSLVDQAQAGEAKAQSKLGDYFYSQSDFTNAVAWYLRAAQQGHIPAQNSLADCYRQGRGVAKNHTEANRWSRQALTQRAKAPSPAPTKSAPSADPIPVPLPKEAQAKPAEPAPSRQTELVVADAHGFNPIAALMEQPPLTFDQAVWLEYLRIEGNGPLTQRRLQLDPSLPDLQVVLPSEEESTIKPTPDRSSDVAQNSPR